MQKTTLFSHINAFFDHVYVVTIERASGRHPALVRELEGLDYELFFGADAKVFNSHEVLQSGLYSEVLSKKNHRYGRSLEGGMLGCSWSHRMVYEDILARGFQKVLVLEDDIRLRPDVNESFLFALEELPPTWDIIWLDYYNNERTPLLGGLKKVWYHLQHTVGALTYSHKTIENLFAVPYSKHLLKAGFHDFSDAYAISHRGAGQLLRMQTPIQWLADNLLAAASTDGELQAFCLRQKLFYQTSQTTDRDQSMISERKV